jgi:hypothetical protein
MLRQVITKKDIEQYRKSAKASDGHAESAIPMREDLYTDRLLKYIPAACHFPDRVCCMGFCPGWAFRSAGLV